MNNINYFSLALIDSVGRVALASELVSPLNECPKMTLTVEGHLEGRNDVFQTSLEKLERQFDADIESLKNTLSFEKAKTKDIKVLNSARTVHLVILRINNRTILKLRNSKDNKLLFLTYKQTKDYLENSKICLSIYGEEMLKYIESLLIKNKL